MCVDGDDYCTLHKMDHLHSDPTITQYLDYCLKISTSLHQLNYHKALHDQTSLQLSHFIGMQALWLELVEAACDLRKTALIMLYLNWSKSEFKSESSHQTQCITAQEVKYIQNKMQQGWSIKITWKIYAKNIQLYTWRISSHSIQSSLNSFLYKLCVIVFSQGTCSQSAGVTGTVCSS